MESCDSCVKSFHADLISESLTQEKNIYLPYYREIITVIPSPSPQANYTSYHLFCLEKNITPFIKSIDVMYDISFSTRQKKNVMLMAMDIYKGGEKITPSDDVIDAINVNLIRFTDLYPNCLLFDITLSSFPKDWLLNVLPVMEKYLYSNGSLFINLEGFPNHAGRWKELHLEVLKTLNKWYEEGVVSLKDANNPRKLISNWRLKPISRFLYKPEWRFRFTCEKSNFLIDRLAGNRNFTCYIGGQWIVRTVDNYEDVEKIFDSIL